MNEAASSDAPPIRPPSTLGFGKELGSIEGLQLPAVQDRAVIGNGVAILLCDHRTG